MTLHLTTGSFRITDPNPYLTNRAGAAYDDLSIHGLSLLYGVSDSSIQMANFKGTSLKLLYEWLSTHGGKQQTADSSVPTGYHWSFQPGMTVVIPGDKPSLSPPPTDEPVIAAGPATGDNEELEGTEVTTLVSEFEPLDISVDDGEAQPAKAAAGGGFLNILLLGVGIFAVLQIMKGKGKGRHKRPIRGRSRRR